MLTFLMSYGMEPSSQHWSKTYSSQEQIINVFHMRCLQRILGVTWQDKVTNNEVPARAGIPSMFTLFRERRLRWLGNVHRMKDGRIPKYSLYEELVGAKQSVGRPHQRSKDFCKRDMRACNIDPNAWKIFAHDRTAWKIFSHDRTAWKKSDNSRLETRWNIISHQNTSYIKYHQQNCICLHVPGLQQSM